MKIKTTLKTTLTALTLAGGAALALPAAADNAGAATSSPGMSKPIDGNPQIQRLDKDKDGTISRIVPTLTPGAIVTTQKNTVDNVVTEHGVAELQGRTLRERARALIAVADPRHREELERSAHEVGILR